MRLGRIDVNFVLGFFRLFEAQALQLLHVVRVCVPGSELLFVTISVWSGLTTGFLGVSQLEHFFFRHHTLISV